MKNWTLSFKIKLILTILLLRSFISFGIIMDIVLLLFSLFLGFKSLWQIKNGENNLSKLALSIKNDSVADCKKLFTNDEIGKATEKVYEEIISQDKDILDEELFDNTNIYLDTINNYLENLSQGIFNKDLSQDNVDESIKPIINNIIQLQNQILFLEDNINGMIDENRPSKGLTDKNNVLQGNFSKLNDNICAILKEYETTISDFKDIISKIIKGDLKSRISIKKDDNFSDLKELFNTLAMTIEEYVKDISNELIEIGKGDLQLTPNEKYVGDFVSVNKSKSFVVSTINSMATEINNTETEVLCSVHKINNYKSEIADRVYMQTEYCEKLFGVIDEISNKTSYVVESIKNATNLTGSSKVIAIDCRVKMVEMLDVMKSVDEASKNILNVIKVIEDIAFQTNILALNASVEAARAGAHGKGFAVVAEEVRNLSMRSQKAVKESEDLISMTVGRISESLEIAETASLKLNEMVDNATKSYDLIDEVNFENIKQNQIIKEANENIRKISDEFTNIKRTIDSDTKEIDNLVGVTNNLKKSTEKFKLIDKDAVSKRIDDDKKVVDVKEPISVAKTIAKTDPIKKTAEKDLKNKFIKKEEKNIPLIKNDLPKANVEKKVIRNAKKNEIVASSTKKIAKEKANDKIVKKPTEKPLSNLSKVIQPINPFIEDAPNKEINEIKALINEKKIENKKSTIPKEERIFKRVETVSTEPLGLNDGVGIKRTKDLKLKTDEEIEAILSAKDFGKY